MRILLLSHYALPHTGGIEVVVDTLARRFAASGHEVVHICSSAVRRDDPPPSAGDVPYRRILLRTVNTLESGGIPYPIFGPSLLWHLWREIGAADIVHAHGLLYEPCLLAAVMARLSGKPLVVTEHVGHVPYDTRAIVWMQAAAFASIGRVTLATARSAIVLNARVEREVRKLSPSTRIVRLSNGVDTERYRPASSSDEREAAQTALGWKGAHNLLLVGRIVEKKGIGAAVAAAAILGGAYQLHLVGPGGGTLMNLPPNVAAEGAQPPDRVATMYRAADALILPSRGEGFPLAVQEALASGVPVFVPADPEFVDVLGGAEPAVQWLEGDAKSIAKTVSAYFGHVFDRQSVSEAAVSFARRRFGWDTVVQRHLEIYEQAMRERVKGDDD